MTEMKEQVNGVDCYRMYIGGQWVDSTSSAKIEVLNPTNEDVIAIVPERRGVRLRGRVAIPKFGRPGGHPGGPRRHARSDRLSPKRQRYRRCCCYFRIQR